MGVRSRYFAVSAAAVLVAAMVFVGACQPKAGTDGDSETKGPYKIGAIVSLSGTYAGLGEPEKVVLEMEVERINAAGGINGHQIELLIEDDGTDDAKAAAAAAKLIEQEGVIALIGATGTGGTMAARAEVEKAGVPQVSMAGGSVITSGTPSLVFATPWANKLVIPYELAYMKDKGIKKIGLISDSGGFGKDGAGAVKAMVADYGIEIVSDQTFNPGDQDMSGQLTKIKEAAPDAILLVSAGKEAAIVAKNRESLKIDIPLYGTHGNARAEFIDGAGTAGEGFRFAAGKILLPESYGTDSEGYQVATAFIEDFKAKTGKDPNTFAGHAYDALYIIVNAMEALPEGFTSAELRDEIEKTAGFVGIGGAFTFSPTDHNGLTADDLNMYEVKGGKWVLAE